MTLVQRFASRTDGAEVAALLAAFLLSLHIAVVMHGAERHQRRSKHLLPVVSNTIDMMNHGRRDGLPCSLHISHNGNRLRCSRLAYLHLLEVGTLCSSFGDIK